MSSNLAEGFARDRCDFADERPRRCARGFDARERARVDRLALTISLVRLMRARHPSESFGISITSTGRRLPSDGRPIINGCPIGAVVGIRRERIIVRRLLADIFCPFSRALSRAW